jgi:hypothetical protein
MNGSGPTCRGCDFRLPLRTSYVPRPDGRYDEVTSVDLDAQRAHLLEHHRPAPRRLQVAS